MKLWKWISLSAALLLAAWALGCVSAPETTGGHDFAVAYVDFDYCQVPVVKQSGQKSCGVAALASLLAYWTPERPVAEGELRDRYPSEGEDGYPLLQLKKIAQAEGVLAFAVSAGEDAAGTLASHLGKGRPVLAAVRLPKGRYFAEGLPLVETLDRRTVVGVGNAEKAHYVIVMGVSHRDYLLMDPQYGYVQVGKDRFLEYWEGMGHAALICSAIPAGVEVQ